LSLRDVPQGAWRGVLHQRAGRHRGAGRNIWREFISEYQSSPNRQKCFCARCGSQLFIRRLDNPVFTVVTLGSIDGDPQVRPERHVFVASKAPWYDIADALPRFRIYPGFEPKDDAPPA